MSHRYYVRDRRRFQRLSINLSVFYRIDSPLYMRFIFGDKEIEATTVDISKGGMAFLTKCNIPVWSVLVIKLILFRMDRQGLVSFNDPVEVIGEVKSCVPSENKEYRLGICFRQVRKDYESEIAQFVQSTL